MKTQRGKLLRVAICTLALAACAALALLTPIGAPVFRPADPHRAGAPITVEATKVESGSTVQSVLDRLPLERATRASILVALGYRVDLRQVRAGSGMRVHWVAGTNHLEHLELDFGPDSTVHVFRSDAPGEWRASMRAVAVSLDTLFLQGVIGSGQSLAASIRTSDFVNGFRSLERRSLAGLVERTLGAKVNFMKLWGGDEYRAVVEWEKRPDGTMRSAVVLALEMTHRGRRIEAVRYVNPEGESGFYDLEGRSVQSFFLLAPLASSSVSSAYQRRRFHPILKVYRPHWGVDYRARPGTPIMATSDGVVARQAASSGYGNVVDIAHANGYLTRYAHMQSFKAGQKVGDRVRQGDVIGYVGMTGLATAPHLHYELRLHGRPLNPETIDRPPGEKIAAAEWDEWERQRDEKAALLSDAEFLRNAWRTGASPGLRADDRER